jgi:hypothetical protein
MDEANQMIAACGIECFKCDILQASNDPKMAQYIADWFKKERNEVVKLEDIRCAGCKSDRTKHWSPDCWILKCCADDKGLEFCNECNEFPCAKLVEWSKTDKGYAAALNRLKEMKKT